MWQFELIELIKEWDLLFQKISAWLMLDMDMSKEQKRLQEIKDLLRKSSIDPHSDLSPYLKNQWQRKTARQRRLQPLL